MSSQAVNASAPSRADIFMAEHCELLSHDDPNPPLNTECPICLEGIEEHVCVKIIGVPSCNHLIGLECIKPFLGDHPQQKKLCPMCRAEWLPDNSPTSSLGEFADIQAQIRASVDEFRAARERSYRLIREQIERENQILLQQEQEEDEALLQALSEDTTHRHSRTPPLYPHTRRNTTRPPHTLEGESSSSGTSQSSHRLPATELTPRAVSVFGAPRPRSTRSPHDTARAPPLYPPTTPARILNSANSSSRPQIGTSTTSERPLRTLTQINEDSRDLGAAITDFTQRYHAFIARRDQRRAERRGLGA